MQRKNDHTNASLFINRSIIYLSVYIRTNVWYKMRGHTAKSIYFSYENIRLYFYCHIKLQTDLKIFKKSYIDHGSPTTYKYKIHKSKFKK